MILVDLMTFAIDQKAPATVILISCAPRPLPHLALG